MAVRKRRRRIENTASGANTGQMMTLSLFIMLLAFFIVLNTLSSYEEIKTEQVKRSVELAFSKDAKDKEQMPSTKPDPAQSLKEGHTFDRIDALFESQISAFEATKSKTRGLMMVRMPYAEFEEAILKVGQKDLLQYPTREAVRGNFFLPTLVSIMRRNIDGAPTRMEIMVNTKSNPAELQNQAPKQLQDIISKVGSFSRRLEKQGMPQKLVNIGVAKGDPKYVDLIFRKHFPFSPVVEEKAP